jgi:hypothetical protein
MTYNGDGLPLFPDNLLIAKPFITTIMKPIYPKVNASSKQEF